MKKISIAILTLVFGVLNASAQVGVGVTGSVNASAKLQVDATNKGFLPPRVALQGTDDATKATPTIASPATGLIVYNTATAGASPNNVTPGIYYYDGSKWQRVINQQPDATVEFSVNADPNTTGTSFSGTAASKDYVYVSTIDNSQWTYNGTAYVTYSPPASTAWYSQSSTTDAGSNKTSGIYRTGNVGVGTTSFTPSTKLDIRASSSGTGLRLVDGSQGANKVLQSDANGYASWANNVAITPAVIGVMGSSGVNSGQNTNTQAYIDLPNGKWSVQVTMIANTTSTGTYWVRTTFVAESGAAAVYVGPTLIGGLIQGSSKLNTFSGTVIINNNTGSTKRYYYWTQPFDAWDSGTASTMELVNFARSNWGENSIVAYPMN
jgi:hypothetical protein